MHWSEISESELRMVNHSMRRDLSQWVKLTIFTRTLTGVNIEVEHARKKAA